MVTNTPRVLREVLPMLIELLVGALASHNLDKRTVAGRALGDLVKKLGDHILPEVVPHLHRELRSGDASMRQGVCLGLAEILEVANKQQVKRAHTQRAACREEQMKEVLGEEGRHAYQGSFDIDIGACPPLPLPCLPPLSNPRPLSSFPRWRTSRRCW